MANLRFSRSEEEGDIVFAQVSDSAGGDVVLDAIWIRTDWRVWFQSQYAFVKARARLTSLTAQQTKTISLILIVL